MVNLRHRTGKLSPLEDHQQTALDWLKVRERAALFLEMSLGKTIVAALYLHYMHYEDCAILKTLIVAPPKVVSLTWVDEFNDWDNFKGMRVSYVVGTAAQREAALNADAEIFIVSVDNLAWLCDYYIKEPRKYKYVGQLPYDQVIIDELDTLKARDGVRSKKFRRAIKTVRYRIGMTGTPIANGYIDLWAQMFLLDEGERLGKTFGEYVDKYFTTRSNGHQYTAYTIRAGADKVIAHKISDIALTMKTRDYMELPDLQEVDEMLTLDGFDRDTYDALERDYCLELFAYEDARRQNKPPDLNTVTVKTAADLTLKLIQASSGALYADQDLAGARKQWFEINAVKMNRLAALLEEHADENIIVVYQFQHEYERIMEAFPHARKLRSGKHLKEDFDEWNAGRIPLLLLHPKSAGHGLNLQYGGRRMIWFSPTHNLGLLMQTISRLVRRGAKWKFYIHFLLCKGTRDAKVRKSNHTKQSEQDFLMEETKQLRIKYGKVRK